MLLQIPTEDEMKKEYRNKRQKVIWGGKFNDLCYLYLVKEFNNQEDSVLIHLDRNLDGIYLEEKTVYLNTIENLSDAIFSSIAKISDAVYVPIEYLKSNNFLNALSKNRHKFLKIMIIVEDYKDTSATKITNKMHKIKTWDIFSKYPVTSKDIKMEYKRRLNLFYEDAFMYGVCFIATFYLSPIGILEIIGSSLLFIGDSIGTFVRYNYLKVKERK